MEKVVLFIVLCILGPFTCPVTGTGSLYDPPSRPVMWKYGYETEKNYNYMQLNCGGEKQPEDGPKQCGVCGDYVNGTRNHELGGQYGSGLIGRYYPAGINEFQVNVELLAFEEGFFEFRLCPANGQPVTQACLDEYLLPIKQGYLTGTPFRFYPKSAGDYRLTIAVPPKITCDRCVLQWRYHTGNSWGTDLTTGKEGKGKGPQEEFYNCADIRIGGEIPASVRSNLFFASPMERGQSGTKNTANAASITPVKPTVVDHVNVDKSKSGSNVVPTASLTINETANAEWLAKIQRGPKAFNTGTSRIDVLSGDRNMIPSIDVIPSLAEATGEENIQSSINPGTSDTIISPMRIQTDKSRKATLIIRSGASGMPETNMNAPVQDVAIFNAGVTPDIQTNNVIESSLSTGRQKTASLVLSQSGSTNDHSMSLREPNREPTAGNMRAMDLTNTFDMGVDTGEQLHAFGSSIGMTGGVHKSSSGANEPTVLNAISAATLDVHTKQLNTKPDQAATHNVGLENTVNANSDIPLLLPIGVDSLHANSGSTLDLVNMQNRIQTLPTNNIQQDEHATFNLTGENTIYSNSGVFSEQPLPNLSLGPDINAQNAVQTLSSVNMQKDQLVSLSAGVENTINSNSGLAAAERPMIDVPFIPAVNSNSNVLAEQTRDLSLNLVTDLANTQSTVQTNANRNMQPDQPVSLSVGVENTINSKSVMAAEPPMIDVPLIPAVNSNANVFAEQPRDLSLNLVTDLANTQSTVQTNANRNMQPDQPVSLSLGVKNTINSNSVMAAEPPMIDVPLIPAVNSNANVFAEQPRDLSLKLVTDLANTQSSVQTNAFRNMQPYQPVSLSVGVDNTINSKSVMAAEPPMIDVPLIPAVNSNANVFAEQPRDLSLNLVTDLANTHSTVQTNANRNIQPDQLAILNEAVENANYSNSGNFATIPIVDPSLNLRSSSTVDLVNMPLPDTNLDIAKDGTDPPNIGIRVDQQFLEPIFPEASNNIDTVVTNTDSMSSPGDLMIKTNLGSQGVQTFVETLISGGGGVRMPLATGSNQINPGTVQFVDPVSVMTVDSLENIQRKSDPFSSMTVDSQANIRPIADSVSATTVDSQTNIRPMDILPSTVDKQSNNAAVPGGSLISTITTGTDMQPAAAINDQLVTDMGRITFNPFNLLDGPMDTGVASLNNDQMVSVPSVSSDVRAVPSISSDIMSTIDNTVVNTKPNIDMAPPPIIIPSVDPVLNGDNLNAVIINGVGTSGQANADIIPTFDITGISIDSIAPVELNIDIAPPPIIIPSVDPVLNGNDRNAVTVDGVGTSGQTNADIIPTADITGIYIDSVAPVEPNIDIAPPPIIIPSVDPVLNGNNLNAVTIDGMGTSGQTNVDIIPTFDITGISIGSMAPVDTNVFIEPIVVNNQDSGIMFDNTNTLILPSQTSEGLATVQDARENTVLDATLLIKVPEQQPPSSLIESNVSVDPPQLGLDTVSRKVTKTESTNDGTATHLGGQQTSGSLTAMKTSTSTEIKPPPVDIMIKSMFPGLMVSQQLGITKVNNTAVNKVPSASTVDYTLAEGTAGRTTTDITTLMKDVRSTKELTLRKFRPKPSMDNLADSSVEIKNEINNFNLNEIPSERALVSNIQVDADGVLRPRFGPRVDRTTQFRNLNRSPITDNIGSNTADFGEQSSRRATSLDVPEGLIPGRNVRIIVDPRTGMRTGSRSGFQGSRLEVSPTRNGGRQVMNNPSRRSGSTSAVVTESRVLNREPVVTSSRSSFTSSVPGSRTTTNGRAVTLRIATNRDRRPSTISRGDNSRTRTVLSTGAGGGVRSNGMTQQPARRDDFRSRVFTTDERRMTNQRFDPRVGRPISAGSVSRTGFRPMVGGPTGRVGDAGIAARGFGGVASQFLPPMGDRRFTGASFDGSRGGFGGPMRGGFPMFESRGFPVRGFPIGGRSPILTPPAFSTGTFDPFMGGTLTPFGFRGF